jgi:hypothetical protein
LDDAVYSYREAVIGWMMRYIPIERP